MIEAISFVGGLIVGIVFIIFIMSRYLTITRVNYQILLKNGENDYKVLNTFTRFYWKQKDAIKDITELNNECEHIRLNYIDGRDFILSLINENFEIDYANIYIKHTNDTVKPR